MGATDFPCKLVKSWKKAERWLAEAELESAELGPEISGDVRETPGEERVQIEERLAASQGGDLVRVICAFRDVFREERGWVAHPA